MTVMALSDILDDLRAAEDGLHKFERRYWISSSDFYRLYSQGLLDDGENSTEFAEWAGHYKLREKRQVALERISQKRIADLQRQMGSQVFQLQPAEPVFELS
jgi:hypothetical protein